MKIEHLRAKNFLCIGDEDLNINFNNLGSIALIKGQNLDFHDEDLDEDYTNENNEYHSNGSGKCFGPLVPIMMFDGTVKHAKDIQVGDVVMGNDSTPRNVLSLARGKEMMYEVVPRKGDSYIVNESHILTFKVTNMKHKKHIKKHLQSEDDPFIYNISVKDYLPLNYWAKSVLRGYKPEFIHFDEKEILIDPYTFGLWAGNDEPSEELDQLITEKYPEVIDNKHIPYCYRCNSKHIRMQLLAGILDARPELNEKHYPDILTQNTTLINDIIYVARSLGYAAYRDKHFSLIQKKTDPPFWETFVYGDMNQIPQRHLKVENVKDIRIHSDDHLVITVNVHPIGEGDYYGFEVDGNHLFLLGDFTVVHNSTISESLVYGLYGTTIRKKVNHVEAINNVNKKKMEVEVIFSIDNTRYKILRTRKPDGLRLWQDGPPWTDDNEITRGGMPATQAQIESLLGINHKAFVNVVCFGQHNDYNFLECTPAEQRQIAESLLSLEVFKDYCQLAKDESKSLKDELKECNAVYEQILSNESLISNRIEQVKLKMINWSEQTKANIQLAKKQQLLIEQEIQQTDIGQELLKYEKAQSELSELKESLPERLTQEKSLLEAIEQVDSKISFFKERIHAITLDCQSSKREQLDLDKDRLKHQFEIDKLTKLPTGAKCPHCFGAIDKKHYKHVMNLHQNQLESLLPKIKGVQARIEKQLLDIETNKLELIKIENLKQSASSKRQALSQYIDSTKLQINKLSKIQMPNLSSNELVLNEKLDNIKETIALKEKELQSGGPYVDILDTAKQDLEKIVLQKENQKQKMSNLEEQLPYYQWWAKGFDEMRAFIIERIVPSLNSKIATWLQFLINGKLEVKFDKHLNVSITSANGDPYAYFAMCGGERKRINLAISQAFAYITMLSSGTWPSVVFLDEVSDSIDQRGIQSIYNMICELSNEKQVFVITHNVHLREMLDGVDTITMQRKDGCTHRM